MTTPSETRIVIFTAVPEVEATVWWSVITRTPGLTAILIVRHVYANSSRAILRRLVRNVRRHGVFFIPYRFAVLVGSLIAGLFRGRPLRRPRTPSSIVVDEIQSVDIHSTEVSDRVRAWNADLGISIGAPILKPALFELPRCGTINVHLGKVPHYRGAPPGFWELWFGSSEVGATIHRVDAGLDTGPVLACATAPIYVHDTPARVEARAAELAQRLLATTIARVLAGTAIGAPQEAAGYTNRMPTIGQRFALWRRLLLRRMRGRLADPPGLAKLTVAWIWLVFWRPLRDFVRTVLGRHPVRVFTFHRITDLCRDGMTVSPASFRKQMEYVRRHHTVVDMHRALLLLAPGNRIRQPIAVITFDDGYTSVAQAARPIMDGLDLTGTCFVSTGLAGTDARFEHDRNNSVRDWLDVMDWTQLAALHRDGWKIGGHTVNHARLSSVSGEELAREIREPIDTLRERLGKRRTVMAFPFGGEGDISADAVAAVKKAGYAALFSDYGGENFPGDDPFTLRRIELGGDHDALMWKAASNGLDLRFWRRKFFHERRKIPSLGGFSLEKRRSRGGAEVRVTHVVFDLDGGGLESLVASMAERWHGSDIRMSVITLSGRVGRVGEAVRPLVEQFHVLRPPRGFSLIAPTGLLRALRATRPHVVHIHSGAWLKGAYAAKLAAVPRVVYTEHGREHHDPWLSRVQDHVASLGTHTVVAVSERLRRYMMRAVAVKPERVVTIPNGVDTELFVPGPPDGALRNALQIPDDALVIGSVGRLEPVKAYSRLVAAYASIRSNWRGPPLVLVIFGEGSDRAVIEAEVQRLGVSDGVRMPGWTDRPESGYRQFDVFAMTSTSEGMSVSLMEAMACGLCPVVTNVGSNAEVLGPSLREHVVPDGDDERLRVVLREMLMSTERRHVAGGLARATAVERHSFQRMILDYEHLYRDEPREADLGVGGQNGAGDTNRSDTLGSPTSERKTLAGRAWSA